MAKIKFSIIFEISEDQASKFIAETPVLQRMSSKLARNTAVEILGKQMFESSLKSDDFEVKDFKTKVYEQ